MAKDVKFNIKLLVDGKEQLVSATTNTKELARQLGNVQREAKNFQTGISRWGSDVLGIAAMQTSINAMRSAMHGLLDESLSFGGAMREANTMAGKNSRDFERLKDQVAELAKTVPVARDALAKGLYQVISNGVPEDNWMSYLETSARSSVGGLANLEEVVKVTSTVIKNYGMEWSDAQAIQDKIQLTAKNGVTSFEQLASALPSVTGQAAQLGVSLEEMLAVMSTLTGVTGNTSEVSTQLASVLTALTKESAKSQKMADAMGISFNAASIKAAGGLRYWLQDLDKAVQAYSQKTGMLSESIYAKLFGRAEALRLVQGLTGEMSDKFNENIEAMKNSVGTMDEAFEDMAGTGSAQTQMLMNRFGALTDKVADFANAIHLMPILDVLGNIGMMAMGFQALAKAINISKIAHLGHVAASRLAAVAQRMFAVSANLSREAAIASALGFRLSAAGLRGLAIAARVAAVAVRGLLIATGVGAAIAALTYVVEKLTDNLGEATDAAEEAAKVESETSRAYTDAQSAMVGNIAKLEGLIDAKKKGKDVSAEEKKVVRELNGTYGQTMGYFASVVEWYKALKANSEAYCRQMVIEAETRQLANQIAEKRQKQHEITHNEDGTQKTYDTKKNKTRLEKRTWKDQTGRTLTGNVVVNESDLDRAQRGYDDLGKSISADERRLNSLVKKSADIKMPVTGASVEPTYAPSGGGGAASDKDKKSGKGGSAKTDTEKHLIENAQSYKDLTNNVAYYQQELEKANITDEATIKDLSKKKQAAEKAVEAFNEKVEAAIAPSELKTLDDYDKALERLRKKRDSASADAIAGLDKEIEATEKARQALEDKGIAALQDGEIKTYNQLNEKLSYYNRLLDEGDEAQRKMADEGIKRLNKLKESWDDALRSLPESTDNLADIDAAIQFYTDRQQKEDATHIQATQRLIEALQAKRSSFELASRLPSMQVEVDQLSGLSGRQRRQKIGDLGIDGLTNQIKELQDLLDDPKQMFTSDQRKQVEDMIAAYGRLRREAARSFDTFRDGWGAIKGVGGAVQSMTEALEGDRSAWEVITTLVDGFIQMYEGIMSIVGIIQMLTGVTKANTAAKTAEAAAMTAATAASGVDAGVQETNALAKIPVIVANKAAAASFMELASAEYFAAHAAIPFAGFGIAAGFTAAAEAIVKGVGLMQFAQGGIVGGTSYTGDKVIARVNSGEMIINKSQQNRLWKMINQGHMETIRPAANLTPVVTGDKQVRFEIDGRKLVGVISNETRVSSKSGRRTGIVL